jgi:DNA adenine methylase
MAKPIIKSAGGKGQLLSDLTARMPKEFERYHEPFGGGLALFLHLWNEGRVPKGSSVGDANPDLIQLYQTLQKDPRGIMHWLSEVYNKNEADYYYAVRAQDPDTLEPAERAARLIYLNKTCFNGLYRVNKQGEFNVPFGKYKKPAFPTDEEIEAIAEALKSVTFYAGDYKAHCKKHVKKGSFVYFDPPYMPVSETANFTEFTQDGFDEFNQLELCNTATALAEKGALVMASNADLPVIEKLYRDSGFTIHKVRARRAINSRGERRGPVGELIMTSY